MKGLQVHLEIRVAVSILFSRVATCKSARSLVSNVRAVEESISKTIGDLNDNSLRYTSRQRLFESKEKLPKVS